MNSELEYISGALLYGGFILAFFLSIFWRPIAGLYYLAPLIPLQTIRYRMNDFPLGASVVILTLFAVTLGLLRRRQSVFPRTPWSVLLYIYCGYTFLSFCMGSFYLGRSAPVSLDDPRLMDWKDYMLMPFLFFLAPASVASVREMKVLLILMCLGILLVNKGAWGTFSDRDYSSYSDDLRDGGPMGQAGANGLAAFEAEASIFLLAIASFKKTGLPRPACYALAAFSAICLMYSLSRGGYAAFLVGLLFVGVMRQRKLLVLLIALGITCAPLAPTAVRSRVMMTYDANGDLDHSSKVRLTLWEDAMQVFESNELLGVGFNTYAYIGRVGNYRDTHNIYIKVLVETGIVGLFLFLWLIGKTYRIGYQLFRSAQDPFLASLGFGLAAWVVCAAAANCFGDRWTFLEVNGYMWVVAGLVARGRALEYETVGADADWDSGALATQDVPSMA